MGAEAQSQRYAAKLFQGSLSKNGKILMPITAQILRIVVASPGDVQVERDSLPAVIAELNHSIAADRGLRLEVSRWETDATPGFHANGPQELIDRVLAIPDCDILICIFWKRFGTPTKDSASGTEHEFRLGYESWKVREHPRIMLYFSQQPYTPRTSEEAMQWANVLQFKETVPSEGLWWSYDDPGDFEKIVRMHLANLIRVWHQSHQEQVSDSGSSDKTFKTRLLGRKAEPAPSAVTKYGYESGVQETAAELRLPDGWLSIDNSFWNAFSEPLTFEEAIIFFDGRSPGWKEVLSSDVPPREKVQELTAELDKARHSGELQVTVLLGASGEGKSTILRQVVVEAVKSGIAENILWHEETTTPLPKPFVEGLLSQQDSWLIVSDDGDQIAKDVFRAVSLLRERGRRKVQFLLCCRDIDWKAAGAHLFHWPVAFIEKTIRGISPKDAVNIVRAWSAYGEKGLGQLSGLDIHSAIKRLSEKAKAEAETYSHEGSFLGAMLGVRIGKEMGNHVKELLDRLNKRPSHGGTLMKAFAYIVALHAIDLPVLSKPVLTKPILAQVLGCSLADIKPHVIGPLGDETAVATPGKYILVRHRAIAETAREILSDTFDEDFEELYVKLQGAARKSFLKGDLEEGIEKPWNRFPYTLFDSGKVDLGIRLARVLADIEPHDPFPVVDLANLYRKAGQTDKAVEVFRQRFEMVNPDRAFFYEWSTAEGNVGNHYISTWLGGISLADDIRERRRDVNRAMVSLSGLTTSFSELFNKTNQRSFIEACAAAAKLGLLSHPDNRAGDNLRRGLELSVKEKVIDVDVPTAIRRVCTGIQLAWEQREKDNSELPESVIPATELTFHRLTSWFKVENKEDL